MHAQAYVMRCEDLGEADVRALCESRVILYCGAESVHVRIVNGRHLDHCMRVAHGHRADRKLATADLQRIYIRLTRRFERERSGREVRLAHVDRDRTVFTDFGIDASTETVHTNPLSPESMRDDTCDAPRTVAALFDLRAVRIEDPVVDITPAAARRQQHQRLVEADAGAPIAEEPHRSVVRHRGVRWCIEHHEVVAEAVHLGKRKAHRRISSWISE